MVVVAPEEDDEWEDGHIARREELVQSFMIAWDSGEAEWLSYPGRAHRSPAAANTSSLLHDDDET